MRLTVLVESLKFMLRTDFHFELPKELIAQRPTEQRSASRLLTLDRLTGACRDLNFRDFPSLVESRDLLIFNDTRVIPARAFGVKDSGGRVELLLERALSANTALAHVRASKGLKDAPSSDSRREQAPACWPGRTSCLYWNSPAM